MKIAIIIVRSLLGLLFVFSAVVVLFQVKMEQPKLSPEATTFMTGLMVTGYFMTLLKVVELICGLMLIVNRWAPLATVMLFPIIVNIVFYHVALGEPKEMPMAFVIVIANLFLAYAYRKNYKTLVMAKPLA